MFTGLKSLFAALTRLTASINRSADLFDAANQHLEQQFVLDHTEPPALEHDEPAVNGTGRRRKVSV